MRFSRINFLITSLIGSVFFFNLVSEAFARAGGGANGGGGILYIILAPFLIIYAWYVNKKINEKKAKADGLLKELSTKDPEWNEEHLEQVVKTKFFEIEKAWCDLDLGKLMEDLHPDLFEEWKIRVDDMRAKGERNVMDDLSLDEVRIVEVKNYRDQDKDIFTACLDAAATDYTVNESGWVVGSNTGSRRKRANNEKSHEKFREFWTFERNNKKWLLLRVDQANEWKKSVNEPLVNEQG